MDCNTCKERKKQAEHVSFQTHQADMARMERTITRLWIALIVAILGLIGMFVYESQWETTTTTQTVVQDAQDGINKFIGGDFYGDADGYDDNDIAHKEDR